MAVAGLHNNVSAFGPSFFGESRPNTRASALVQMWRELENEHMINQSYRSRQQIRNGSDTECSTTPKSISGRGSENDDEFENQEEHEDNISIISDDLGETERERVRQIFQEWMSNGSKVHSSNGQIFHGPEMGARRPIRRLCGRQTLLDLLVRAQNERKDELSRLAELRPVSEFAYRNRIQVLLRGRFLRIERVVQDERPSSRGATELGLLRERHTVSDLRDGFLSKLDRCVSTTSFSSAEAESVSTTSSYSKSVAGGNRNVQKRESQVTKADKSIQHYEALETSEDFTVASESSSLECEVINENYDLITEEYDPRDTSAQVDGFRESIIEFEDSSTERRSDEDDDDSRDDDLAASIWQEDSVYDEPYDNNFEEREQQLNQESSHVVEWPSHDLQEAIDTWLDMPSGRFDTFYPPDDDDSAHGIEIRELFSRRHVSSLLGSSFRESLNRVLQSHMERLVGHASGDWETDSNSTSFPALNEQGQVQEQQHPNGADGNEWNPFADSQQPLWDDDEFRGTNSSHRMERLVGLASGDWETDIHSTSFPSLNEQGQVQEQQHPNGADGNEWNPFPDSQQPLWDDDEFRVTNSSHHNSDTHLETESEVINELRIDMASLQQRMDSMQSMLEACMEMQFELKRSVREDLSVALNRPVFSRDEKDASEDNRVPDESQLDFVRRGICCVCRDSKIDSLLYRCGHICTCSKCADKLVRCKEKCPICLAPAVEAVQACFIK